jgi:hypothetical protein
MVAKARALIRDKKAQEAIAQSQAAIQLDDKRWEAYVTAASGYSAQQFYDDAVGMLQMALVRAPEDKKQLVRDAITEARGLSVGHVPPSNSVRPQPPPDSPNPTQAEVVLWKSIENSSRIDDFVAYLQKYPNGTFATLASARVEKLKTDAAAEGERKRQEQDKQAEIRKYTYPVAHLHARLTLSSNPGGFGHLHISPDGASYEGDDGNASFAKSDVTYLDIARTGVANFLRLHASSGNWSFAVIDEADVQNHKFTGAYPPGLLENVIAARWGFVWSPDRKRVVPPAP